MGLLAWLWYYLWIAPYVLQVVLFGGMVRRRLYRDFPVFFAYTGWEPLAFVVLFSLARRPATTPTLYFTVYCVFLAISTTLRFGILHEIFASVLKDYATLRRLKSPVFRWGTMVLLLVGLGLVAYARGNNADQNWFLLHAVKQVALILQSGLLFGLFLFLRYLNLSWRNPLFGIALGMGTFASVELAAAAIRARTGYVYTGYLDYVTMGTYHLCVVIWLYYLLVPRRGTGGFGQGSGLQSLPDAADVESWNQELERLLRP